MMSMQFENYFGIYWNFIVDMICLSELYFDRIEIMFIYWIQIVRHQKDLLKLLRCVLNQLLFMKSLMLYGINWIVMKSNKLIEPTGLLWNHYVFFIKSVFFNWIGLIVIESVRFYWSHWIYMESANLEFLNKISMSLNRKVSI